MTRIAVANTPDGSRYSYLYYLIAPATGANNVVVSASGSYGIFCISSSYTGALQSGQPDSSGTLASDSTTSLAVATTVVASNCWLVGQIVGLGTLSAGSIRGSPGNNTHLGDSNTTVGTGSQNLTWTGAASRAVGVTASIAPAAVVAAKTLAALGVG